MRVVLSARPSVHAAHRIQERPGFVHASHRDRIPLPHPDVLRLPSYELTL